MHTWPSGEVSESNTLGSGSHKACEGETKSHVTTRSGARYGVRLECPGVAGGGCSRNRGPPQLELGSRVLPVRSHRGQLGGHTVRFRFLVFVCMKQVLKSPG